MWLNFGARSFGYDLPLSFLKTRGLSPLLCNFLEPQNDSRVKHGPNDSIFAQGVLLVFLLHLFDRRVARSGSLNTTYTKGLGIFDSMDTPGSYSKGSVRWQYILNGYTKYWYLRSALRWLSIVSSVTALIVFGIVYHTYAEYKHVHTLYLGTILFIVAVSELEFSFSAKQRQTCIGNMAKPMLTVGKQQPLLSFITNATALALLFLSRRKFFVNPGWLLSGDLISGLLMSVNLAFNGQYVPGWYGGFLEDGLDALQTPWCFCLVLGAFHVLLFLCEIWEVHYYRRMRREQSQAHQDDDDDSKHVSSGPEDECAEPQDIELQSPTSPIEHWSEAPDTPLHTEVPDNAVVEMPGTLRVELPDGRILELPEGCRVELPADHRAEHRAELPDNRRLRLITQPYELDSTSTASTQWYGSSPVAPSYKTADW